MATAYQEVSNAFSKATSYADSALQNLYDFTAALNETIKEPPSVGLSWTQFASPTITSFGVRPSMQTVTLSVPSDPGSLTDTLVETTFDTFTEAAPALSFPPAPTLTDRVVPGVPTVGTVTVDPAPEIEFPPDPTLMGLSTVTFAGLDIHEDWLAKLETIPTLTLVEPTPYSYARGPSYESSLLTEVQSKLYARLQGGTGLTPAVEQAIWDRARDREAATAQGNIDEVQRTSDALGFQLPAGVVAARIREAQAEYYDKVSSISRDVAIKQAEMEQSNLKDAVAAGMQLESKLIDYSLQLERLAFDTSKEYADNSIKVYNTLVEGYKAALSGYQTFATAYKTLIDAEMAKVETYKTQVQAEQTKAQINTAAVEQYKALIQAKLGQIEIYKAQLDGARTLMELERVKIQAASEAIHGVVAQINADTAKIEAYKAGVQGQTALLDVYKTKAEVFKAKVGAQAEAARTRIAEYDGKIHAYTARWDGFKSKVMAEAEKVRAIASSNQTAVEAFKAEAAATEAEARMHTQVWEARIKEYEAMKSNQVQVAKVNNDFLIANRAANIDAAKAGAQVYAQLASSAYGMIHAQASIQASEQNAVQYQYGGSTSSSVSPISRL